MKSYLDPCRASTLLLVFVGIFLAHASPVFAVLEPVSGEVTREDGEITATTLAVFQIPVAADNNLITLRGRTGKAPRAMAVSFLGQDGKAAVDSGGTPVAELAISAGDLKLHGKETLYPDAFIRINRPLRYFVRPNLKFYRKERFDEIVKSWDSLPGASAHPFLIEIRRGPNRTLQLWFDGNFMQEFPPAEIGLLRVTLAPGASLRELSASRQHFPENLVLPLSTHPRLAGMENVRLKLDANAVIPAELKPGAEGRIAVQGLSLFQNIVTDDLQSYYFRRTAADALPEQRIFTVPQATYAYANLLVAVDDDPAKTASFTLRVTRYGRSRGNAMADTIVSVPRAGAVNSPNATRVGTIQYGPLSAPKETPLWLLKVPIKNGLIQDILHQDDKKSENMATSAYLDVELMDPLHQVETADAFPPPLDFVGRGYRPSDPQYTASDFYRQMPPPATSAAYLFGISLEPSPAGMEVRSNIKIQAFHASDQPAFELMIAAKEEGHYTAFWEYADLDGRIVQSDRRAIGLEAGARGKIIAPVTVGNGWYSARFRLTDARGEDLIDYRTSFVILPPDTRKAGLESPFYGWWFGKNHGDAIPLDEIGPLLERLGIRRVGLPDEMTENLTLPNYRFTNSTVRFTGGGRKALEGFRDGKLTLEEAVAIHEADIRGHLERWPSIDRMLVFHESRPGGAPFPSELWGQPARTPQGINDVNSPEALLRREGMATPAEEETRAKYERTWPKRMEYLDAMVKMVRDKFPHLKMQYGNDGNSLGIVGELFRRKFPRASMDTIASEDLGQTIAPERDTVGSTQDGWYLRELARKMGYEDVPVTATTEWIGRMTERLGLRKQAQWKARDGILALAYGYDTISLAGVNDAGDAYYYSIWANGGLTGRYPVMAPKPAYAAVATLTRVLDQARFSRFVPTGSTVCYLAEFQRGEQWVYALWTPRGNREVTLSFGDSSNRPLIDLYGRESGVEGREPNVIASPSVQYIVSGTPIRSAAAGDGSFPEDVAKAPSKPLETIALESLDAVKIVPDPAREISTAKSDLEREIEGTFEIRAVLDPEMGRCLEIELKPEKERRLGEVEFVNLVLATPRTTKARNAGVWIKGNGSWGAVDLLKNRRGPWADNTNLQMRWPGDATLNFDGWNFIMYPFYDWVKADPPYDTTVVRGLRITFPQTTLVGTERVPVGNQKVRIKGIQLF